MPDYRICGLTIHSQLELPGAIVFSPANPDVRIELAPVPDHLVEPIQVGPLWQLTQTQFLLNLPDVGRFCATEGHLLQLQPADGVDPDDAVPFLLGTGLGALLYQRGALVLHASCVVRDGVAIAICGRSGMGKSTLAAALCQSGFTLVSDDLTVIRLGKDGTPVAEPDGRYLKLFDDAIKHLDLGDWRRERVRIGIGKHYVAPATPTATDAVPLQAIYELSDQLPRLPCAIIPMSPMDGVQSVLNQCYRRRLALALADRSGHIVVSAALFRHVPVFELRRPFLLDRLGSVVADLSEHWHTLSAGR